MDGTIVTVALPSVGEELDADSHQLSYVLTAYFLAYAVDAVPGWSAGRPHRLAPRRLAGLAVFAAGAVIGALAGSFEVLVASRVVQGVGAGLVSPASLAGAVSGFPAERRGTALGIWGASSGVANLIGPVVGGLLTVAIDWRACWWFLVPASGAAAFALWRLVPRDVHVDASPDAAGLRQRVVAAAALVAALTFAVMIGTLLHRSAVPAERGRVLGARRGRGAHADRAARRRRRAVLGPARRTPAARAPPSRSASGSPRSGLGVLAIPGVPLEGIGALPLLVPFGLGLGMLFVPASRAALNAVPQAKHGRVSSLLSTARLLGAGLGAVLGGAALSGGVTERPHAARAGRRRRTLRGGRLARRGRRSRVAGARRLESIAVDRAIAEVKPSRKVRTPQGRVVGSADPGKPAGKCHRNDTA